MTFELMLGSGHLCGYHVNRIDLEEKFIRDLEHLVEPADYHDRYGLPDGESVLLFAMGDGNHSLATAKAIWEKMKASVPANHPARYALVEVENVHDAGLEFEPIHRVLFNLKNDIDQGLRAKFGSDITFESRENPEAIRDEVLSCPPGIQKIGCVDSSGWRIITFRNPKSNLAVGTLQEFLDEWKLSGGFEKIDYVHGWEAVTHLGRVPGNTGFFLPSMLKTDLFKTVLLDGALPRKTFSMGEAKEKRFYMECRKIVAEL